MPCAGGPRAAGRRVMVALTAGAAALLAITACTSGSAATTPSGPAAGSTQSPPAAGGTQAAGGAKGAGPIVPTASTLHWHSCPAQLNAPDCTTLSVPLKHADPGGRHISIALDMVPATAPPSQQQGVMLVNPGGPGASGLPWAPILAQGLSPSVARDYDIVGFDPRGTGASVPALSCDPGFFSGSRPNYVPASAAAEQVLIGRAKMYASDCERRFGWLLPYMTTQDMARDLDAVPRSVRRRDHQLLRVLLGHVPRPGVRHPVPRPRPSHGPGQHRRSHRGLVHRQHRPGLCLPAEC